MTTEEKIEVMMAFIEGKQIQIKNSLHEYKWVDYTSKVEPNWEWGHSEYRIKPEKEEPTYRPYKTQLELLNDYWAKAGTDKIAHIFGGLWLKDKETEAEYLVNALNSVDSFDIKLGETWFTYEQAFKNFVYLDDTPFGVKE